MGNPLYPTTREEMLELADSPYFRRADLYTLALLHCEDQRGRFSHILLECPDCGRTVASPPLRTDQDMEDLLDSDLTDYHRCEAMVRN